MWLELSLHHDSIRSSTLEKSKIIFQKNRSANHYACVHAELLQSCPSLHDPMNCSPAGSSVHRILQARVIECSATLSSSGSSQPRYQTLVFCIVRQVPYHSHHLRRPDNIASNSGTF